MKDYKLSEYLAASTATKQNMRMQALGIDEGDCTDTKMLTVLESKHFKNLGKKYRNLFKTRNITITLKESYELYDSHDLNFKIDGFDINGDYDFDQIVKNAINKDSVFKKFQQNRKNLILEGLSLLPKNNYSKKEQIEMVINSFWT